MIAPPPLTAVILTYNEALHLRRCIERLRPIASRVVVVDSFSTDGTVEIARELGADIFQQKFVNHAAQFQWGIDQAAITDGWVLRIDADEYLEPAALAPDVEIRDRERRDGVDQQVRQLENRWQESADTFDGCV